MLVCLLLLKFPTISNFSLTSQSLPVTTRRITRRIASPVSPKHTGTYQDQSSGLATVGVAITMLTSVGGDDDDDDVVVVVIAHGDLRM